MAGIAGRIDGDAAAEAARRRRSFDAVGAEPPADPAAGTVWYDTDARGGEGAVKLYEGEAWVETVVVIVGLAPGNRPTGAANAGGGA